jgi:Effector-associated domain 8
MLNLQSEIVNIIRLLTRFMSSKDDRNAILKIAFFGQDGLLSGIDADGSASVAIPLIVDKLNKYGTIGEQEPIVILLRYIYEHGSIGDDVRNEFKNLIQRLETQAGSAKEQALSNQVTPAPNKVQTKDPNTVTRIRVVVASPSDVQAERNILDSVIDDINRGVAADRNIILQLYRWETDAYPQFHLEGGQGAIDEILKIDECDILIGIFWKRFGTPIADGRTGTEHEINIAIETWERTKTQPQIMIYFSQQLYSPRSSEETTQWGRVLDYKKSLQSRGLLGEYEGVDDFKDKVRKHLTQLIRTQYPL